MAEHDFPAEPFKFYSLKEGDLDIPIRVLCGCVVTDDRLLEIGSARETRLECIHGNALIIRAHTVTVIRYSAKRG
jgi:hypothetical protein